MHIPDLHCLHRPLYMFKVIMLSFVVYVCIVLLTRVLFEQRRRVEIFFQEVYLFISFIRHLRLVLKMIEHFGNCFMILIHL